MTFEERLDAILQIFLKAVDMLINFIAGFKKTYTYIPPVAPEAPEEPEVPGDAPVEP